MFAVAAIINSVSLIGAVEAVVKGKYIFVCFVRRFSLHGDSAGSHKS